MKIDYEYVVGRFLIEFKGIVKNSISPSVQACCGAKVKLKSISKNDLYLGKYNYKQIGKSFIIYDESLISEITFNNLSGGIKSNYYVCAFINLINYISVIDAKQNPTPIELNLKRQLTIFLSKITSNGGKIDLIDLSEYNQIIAKVENCSFSFPEHSIEPNPNLRDDTNDDVYYNNLIEEQQKIAYKYYNQSNNNNEK